MRPDVSVVIPTRNSQATIEKAIACVQAQSDCTVECIVVDDSTDATRSVAADAGARVIPGRGQGVSAARNLGTASARGWYIAYLDADDSWAPMKLAMQLRLIQAERDLAMVGTQFEIAGDLGGTRQLQVEDASLRGLSPVEFLASPRLPASVFLVRSDVARVVRFPDGVSDGEDTIYAAEMRTHGLIGCVEQVLMTRHLRPGSLSHSPGHVSKNFLARLAYLRHHWEGLGATDYASAERVLVHTQVEDAWAYYWRGDFENFRLQRRELRESWPVDIPVPTGLTKRTWPDLMVRLRRHVLQGRS